MKLIYLYERIKLKNEYNNNVKQVRKTLDQINTIQTNFDFADSNMQVYYSYELKLLKAKYNQIINQLKIIDKNLENV